MKNYYFTFGLGTPFKNFYIKVTALTRERAIDMMLEIFTSFAGIYDEEYWRYKYDETMSEKYNLQLLTEFNAEVYFNDRDY